MSKRHRRLVAAGATAAAVGIGIAGIAGAQAGGSGEADQTQDPSYSSSVTAPEGDHASEADESKALDGLATISADDARAAALAAVPGTAGDVELENENGNVVYGVEVTGADGSQTDVKVDAGNGAVLSQQPDDGDEEGGTEESEADEANEGPETDEGSEGSEPTP